MSGKSLAPTWGQREKLSRLIDELGVNRYRDIKANLGIGRMRPFQRLAYAEAMQVIEFMESVKNGQFGNQGRNGNLSDSQQHPQNHTHERTK